MEIKNTNEFLEFFEKIPKDITRRFFLRNSFNLIISGFILEGGDIEEIPEILIEMSNIYKKEIKKLSKEF